MTSIPTLRPAWPAPSRVRALFTTRAGGVSSGPWSCAAGVGGLNLGANCGDDPEHVARNRQLLAREVGMPIHWLGQVHGSRVVEVLGMPRLDEDASVTASHAADAQVTCVAGVALGILVADCLPVLIADRAGTVVGAAHAGWRGLAAGVLENTVEAMRRCAPAADLVAWLGPCIGPKAFEVGEDVLQAFTAQDPKATGYFAPGVRDGKWWADLAGLAAWRLRSQGVAAIVRADACTVADPGRFWSYRRDGTCGRMAGIIGLRD